jgi:hypothetical protein
MSAQIKRKLKVVVLYTSVLCLLQVMYDCISFWSAGEEPAAKVSKVDPAKTTYSSLELFYRDVWMLAPEIDAHLIRCVSEHPSTL